MRSLPVFEARPLLRRLGQMLFVLWVVTTLQFFLFRLMPGSPLAAYIDTVDDAGAAGHPAAPVRPGPAAVAAVFPLFRQSGAGQPGLFVHLQAACRWADPGCTAEYAVADADVAVGRLCFRHPVRAPFSLRSAAPGSRHLCLPVVLASRALPEFWLGMVLLAVFSFTLGLFPAGGATSRGRKLPQCAGRAMPRSITCVIWCCRH